MASVPPVEAPMAMTAELLCAGAGGGGSGLAGQPAASSEGVRRRRANLGGEVHPQFPHGVRAAGLGQHLYRAETQRVERRLAAGRPRELITTTGMGW